jgi:hypothetical protein
MPVPVPVLIFLLIMESLRLIPNPPHATVTFCSVAAAATPLYQNPTNPSPNFPLKMIRWMGPLVLIYRIALFFGTAWHGMLHTVSHPPSLLQGSRDERKEKKKKKKGKVHDARDFSVFRVLHDSWT